MLKPRPAQFKEPDDDFTNTLLKLVNQEYPKATKEEKIARLKDVFENPYGNTACVEKSEIAGFFYQHYPEYKKLQSKASSPTT